MKNILTVVVVFLLVLSCTKQSSVEYQKMLVDTYVKYWNTGDFNGIEDILHPEFELLTTPKYNANIGIEKFKETVTKWRTAYPDFNISLDEEIYGDNKGAVRWTIVATHTGQGNMPPTGKRVKVKGISLFHIVDGKIKDEWIAGNNLHWLRQLGFTLAPPKD